MDSRGKVIAITGASEGIGRELALVLAERGARLVLGARNREALERVRAECEGRGSEAMSVPVDVGDEKACEAWIAAAVDRFGALDVLVNNAGISHRQRFDETEDVRDHARLMDINYLGAVRCTLYALPHIAKSRGLIVAVSSGQGKTGFPGFTAYSASKFAMQGFFDSLRIELYGSGVDVLVVCPGPVATQIHDKGVASGGAEALPVADSKSLPADECARRIANAIERRQRELSTMPMPRTTAFLKIIAPKAVDRMIQRAVNDFYGER